jgi:hypothetical protein
MKSYKISIGTGLAWLHQEVIEVEDFEHEQDALDKMIDGMEERGEVGFFKSHEEIEAEEINDDEYIIGGNHGLCLMHYGSFVIEELNK